MNPTTAGDVLVIYVTGMGDVDPRVLAGAAAPVTPLSQTVNPVSVTIGGIVGTTLFTGLTPGFTGLHTPGDAVVLVLTQAGKSSPPVSISVR